MSGKLRKFPVKDQDIHSRDSSNNSENNYSETDDRLSDSHIENDKVNFSEADYDDNEYADHYSRVHYHYKENGDIRSDYSTTDRNDLEKPSSVSSTTFMQDQDQNKIISERDKANHAASNATSKLHQSHRDRILKPGEANVGKPYEDMTEKNSTESETKHWVQDLFPPMFGYSERELLEGPELVREEGLMGSEHRRGLSGKHSDDLFFQLAQVMSEVDAAAIRNVYRRVWVLRKLKQKKLQAAASSNISQSAAESSEKKHLSATATTTVQSASNATNLQKPITIWTAEELEILRREFRLTKDTNQSLTSEIDLLKEELKSCKSREAALISELSDTKLKLNEAGKANTRFKILAENLKKTLDKETKICKSLREEIKQLRERLKQEQRKTVEVQKQLRAESAKSQCLETSLKAEHSKVEDICEKVAETVRRKWVERVHLLEDSLKQVTEELELEKQDHQRTSRGLEKLRVHFSSLPLSVIDGSHAKLEGIMRKEGTGNNEKQMMSADMVQVVGLMLKNVVTKDEITDWTY